MKVLITGVAGFIGSNLANSLLKNNIQVVGVDNLSYGILDQVPKDVEFHQMDIRDKNISDIFDHIDYVFHLAAKNCITDCQEEPIETFDINVNGTINIFEAAIKKNIKKVIYAESSSVYEGATSLPSKESEVFPESIYAISKITTNFLAKEYGKSKGLVTTGLRYFNVYGPRQDYRRTIPPVFSAFIINLLNGKQPTIFGDGSKKRDFVYVDDVNNFHLMCIQDDRTNNEVFNIGSGKYYSINEIYNEIKHLLNSNIEPLFGENFSFEAQNNLADISKARKIGWNVKTDLKNGLKKSIDYIKENVI
tara:strand:+ start:27266 stop:28183 length:918 start_codon:yes stop_codon:yes gene_type:complete